MKSHKGKLVLIVGPSGSGKGSIIRELRLNHPEFVYPVSFTTRAKRPGEEDGLVYRFISREEFEKGIKGGRFLEYATVHGVDYYGTDRAVIEDGIAAGKVVVREVDIQGFHSIEGKVPDMVSIFIEAKSLEQLQKRILGRSQMSLEELARRMESAAKEIAQASECDYKVVNEEGKLGEAVMEVERIIFG